MVDGNMLFVQYDYEDGASSAVAKQPGAALDFGRTPPWTRLDGNTETVYANFRGQPILTDLYDPASDSHTLTYTRYDTDGRVVLAAESSAFVLSSGQYYDEDLPDLVVYAGGNSPYLSDAAGLFQVTTYYASTSQGIDEDTAGGVED